MNRLTDSREGNLKPTCHGNIVVPDDRHLRRNGNGVVVQTGKDTHGNVVVCGEDGRLVPMDFCGRQKLLYQPVPFLIGPDIFYQPVFEIPPLLPLFQKLLKPLNSFKGTLMGKPLESKDE